jgi:hypothetical protein
MMASSAFPHLFPNYKNVKQRPSRLLLLVNSLEPTINPAFFSQAHSGLVSPSYSIFLLAKATLLLQQPAFLVAVCCVLANLISTFAIVL